MKNLFQFLLLICAFSTICAAAQGNTGVTTSLIDENGVAVDPRVRIVTPNNTQQFAPGDAVSITVSIAAPLRANDIAVEVGGIGIQPGLNYDGSTYQARFTIPHDYAGSLTLRPTITDTSNNFIVGVSTKISVRLASSPKSLSLAQDKYILTSLKAKARLTVSGNYRNGLRLPLTSSASGTSYLSSNQQVITVDADGVIQATGLGTAIVTVENSGVKAFATIIVKSFKIASPPQDVTNQVNVHRSKLVLNQTTDVYVQTVTITNVMAIPIVGPLYLMLSDMPTGTTLLHPTGKTQAIPPLETLYIQLALSNGNTLGAGQSNSIQLQFLNPARIRMDYTFKVVHTTITP